MTKARRVGSIFLGVIMVLFGALVAVSGGAAYRMIIVIFGISMLLASIRQFVYYLSMARHMVGGRTVLYRAVILFDVGLFTITLIDAHLIFLVIYLAGVHGFSGVIDIMRSVEAKRLQAPSWKLSMSHGIINVIMALLCLIFLKQAFVAVLIYGIGLIYSGIIRVIQAFRRTAVVYIQ